VNAVLNLRVPREVGLELRSLANGCFEKGVVRVRSEKARRDELMEGKMEENGRRKWEAMTTNGTNKTDWRRIKRDLKE
jgi:hypothetical protein